MDVIEIKAFVPAKDLELSKRFYQELGFTVAWSSDDLAYLHVGSSSFLLQRFYVQQHAGNFMMSMLVPDVEALVASRRNPATRPTLQRPRLAARRSAMGHSGFRAGRSDRRALADRPKHQRTGCVLS